MYVLLYIDEIFTRIIIIIIVIRLFVIIASSLLYSSVSFMCYFYVVVVSKQIPNNGTPFVYSTWVPLLVSSVMGWSFFILPNTNPKFLLWFISEFCGSERQCFCEPYFSCSVFGTDNVEYCCFLWSFSLESSFYWSVFLSWCWILFVLGALV